MNLFHRLQQRDEENRPLRVGLIGAGKFGPVFLVQLLRLPGVHPVGIADINRQAVRPNLAHVDLSPEQYAAAGLDVSHQAGLTHVGDDAAALIRHPAVEIVIEQQQGMFTIRDNDRFVLEQKNRRSRLHRPVVRSTSEVRFFHFATVFGLIW